MHRPFSIGALIGVLLTAPLVAVSYLAWRLFDRPFAPFDLFDWMARALPGTLATFAIDVMVRVTGALPFSTASTAKIVEQSIAVGLMLAGGALCGALLFTLLVIADEPALLLGGIVGALLGGAMVIVEQSLNRLTSPGAFVSGTWVFGTFLCWGVAFGWICDRVRLGHSSGARTSGPSESPTGRRRFLGRLGTAAAALTVAGTACGALFGRTRDRLFGDRWSSSHPLPNAGASVVPAPGTRPELTSLERHYRIDIVTRPPAINGSRWRLQVGGLVERPLQMTLDEIRSREPMHQFVTLACISNPVGGDLIGTTRWTGVSLQRLLMEWRIRPAASHLKLTSADGFSEVVAVETIAADPRVMLAYAWDGVPLPIEHGFPLRLYVPDRYGMKQPKWIQSIEALDHWEPGYWVERGWDREGRMKSSAVIDTVAVNAQTADAAGRPLASIGGIAHAGSRGISKVEVQIDGGDWQPASLRDPMSDTTWVVWRADVPLRAGDHAVTVRGYERDGTPQTSAPHSTRARA